MGANMARRLKDQGYHITSVFDSHRPAATTLAQELGSFASSLALVGQVSRSDDKSTSADHIADVAEDLGAVGGVIGL